MNRRQGSAPHWPHWDLEILVRDRRQGSAPHWPHWDLDEAEDVVMKLPSFWGRCGRESTCLPSPFPVQNVVALGGHKFIVFIIALELNLGVPLCVNRLSDVLEIALLVDFQIGGSVTVAGAVGGGTQVGVPRS